MGIGRKLSCREQERWRAHVEGWQGLWPTVDRGQICSGETRRDRTLVLRTT